MLTYYLVQNDRSTAVERVQSHTCHIENLDFHIQVHRFGDKIPWKCIAASDSK